MRANERKIRIKLQHAVTLLRRHKCTKGGEQRGSKGEEGSSQEGCAQEEGRQEEVVCVRQAYKAANG